MQLKGMDGSDFFGFRVLLDDALPENKMVMLGPIHFELQPIDNGKVQCVARQEVRVLTFASEPPVE